MGDPWKSIRKAEKQARREKKEEKKREAKYQRYVAIGGAALGVIVVIVMIVSMMGEGEPEPIAPEVAQQEAERIKQQNKAMYPKVDEKKDAPK